jgi:Kef-type K+ transport system membrane component KefB
MDIASTTARFFLAAVVVLVVCRLVTMVMRRIGQPPVIGEMVAGVLLGPSLLGLVLPGVQDALFPDSVRPMLYVVSHIGLVAFMFEVGHEFKSRRVRGVGRAAGMISAAGVTAPLLLGMVLVFTIGNHSGVLASGIPLWVSALFVGVTLAITAFPMLARIISERGLTKTRYGSLSMACGALDDGVAWVLLAVVVAAATGDPSHIVMTAGGSVLFVLFLAFVGRPVLAWVFNRKPALPVEQLVLVSAIGLFAAAWYTDTIGLYSVFGGFCLGFVFPSGPVADRVVGMISPVTKTVFLPLFFAYSGLNTQFGLLVSPTLLLLSLAFIVAAIAGKFGGCLAAARLAGERRDVAVRVGVLMNARGLMQLIALNVGLQQGIATPALFSALVLVAMVTTIMTSPWLSYLDRREPGKPSHAGESVEPSRTLTASAPDDEGEPG